MTAEVTSPVTALVTAEELGQATGLTWFDYQAEAFEVAEAQADKIRMCLYYRTGAGKTITSLAIVRLAGYTEAVVIAPPVTHEAWEKWGTKLGVKVTAMSHAKYRMPKTKLSRHVPVIADEFHLFGGHQGKGWKKFDTMAGVMPAPVILASATPNYNDAERVYCIQHVLDPGSVRGGYIEFLYRQCETEENPFGKEPNVLGFRNHKDATEYLDSLPGVVYVPDTVVYDIEDIELDHPLPYEFDTFGLDRRRERLIASQMERRHAVERQQLVDGTGLLRQEVYREVREIIDSSATPVLVFCAKAEIARAVKDRFVLDNQGHGLVTGATTPRHKKVIIEHFRRGVQPVLIGTSTLATGTDGLDKMCDTLVIINDTDDDALRRQLIGRIMPRGKDSDASKKRVYRIVMHS